MQKIYKALSINIIFLFISSCANDIPVTNKQLNVDSLESVNNFNINTEIKGKVNLADFKTKASTDTISKIVSGATVSVIYPADYPTVDLRNNTIATGLTDKEGNFVINTEQKLTPKKNDIFILDVSKRVGGIGSSVVSLRTHIRWNGTSWDSITKPSIFIDKDTTTISIISGFDPLKLSSNDTIGRISVQNDNSTILFDSKLSSNTFQSNLNTVSQLIFELKDPIENIYGSGDYLSTRTKLLATKSNMRTFQTTLETYAVDWSGIYPKTTEALITEAKQKSYYKNMKNPFYLDSQISNSIDSAINYTDYIKAKQTLTYKGIRLEEIADLKGVVVFKPWPETEPGFITRYDIYGVDINGEFIKEYGTYTSADFVLTNQ